MTGNQFSLFNTKRFLPLFITQFLGAFNDNVFKNAFVVLITYNVGIRDGWPPELLVIAASGIFILPFFLFSAMAGQYADKLEKSAMIRKIKLIEIILMAIGAVGFFIGDLYLLFAVLFLMGTQSTFFGPIKYGILPDHLKEEELIAGNGLIEMATFLAILLGTIIGGLLILTDTGIETVSGLLLFVAVFGYVSSKKIPLAEGAAPDLKINYNFIGETANIIGKAHSKKRVFLSIMGISWFWFYGATFLSQFPIFASQVLNSNEEVVTLLLCTFSVGIGLGSMICNRLVKGEVTAKFVPIASLGMTIFTIDLYFASANISAPAINVLGGFFGATDFLSVAKNWRVLVDLLFIAICGGIYIVPLYTIMQKESDPAERSRAVAANNIINSLFMVVSALGCLALITYGFSLPEIFLIIGILNLGMAIYVCKLLEQGFLQSIKKVFSNFL